MKVFKAAVLPCVLLVAGAEQARSNPLGKVLQLVDDLTAKIIKEGEAEAKAYHEYFEWCDETSKNTDYAIKTSSDQKAKLEAQIDKLTSDIEVAGSKIEELSAAIAKSEAEAKSATLIREKEAAEFATAEKELMEAVDALGRALSILEKEMAKNPAALAQVDTSSMASVIQGLGVVLDAAAFPSNDRKRLLAFVQAHQGAEEDDSEFGAPAAEAYKSHSGGIVEVLEDMKDKAEAQLSELRKAEVNAKHNYEMLKQSLEDQVAADSKDMGEEKSGKAAAEEAKATAESDLETTNKDLANSKEQLATAHSSCMQTAADHEATVASRAEELKAIAEAKKILEETSAGAVSQSYSFLQMASGAQMLTRTDLARSEVITMVKRLARQHHSAALAQLASRMAAVVKLGGAAGEDPFAKVKGLIADMITKLETEANDEAVEKAYCDEQMSKTEAKQSELEEDVAKMTSKIDTAAAKMAQLKEEVKELQSELAALAKDQATMDKIRAETHAEYEVAKAELELGISGVRRALDVLREYYGGDGAAAAMLQAQQPAAPEKHAKAQGAGSGIIGILEVVESDFASNLAKEETEEDDAQSEYDKVTQENKVTKTVKDQDVKYKSQEIKSLDARLAELSEDRATTNSELSAVSEYFAKVKDRCIAKPETYEERQRRREAEISGLKEALAVLKDETAFVQRKHRGSFRGTLSASMQ
mmetsp:Transcript_55691/g.145246  ORF Transcript_55691/g.145246 Transcript_55691/m.145246 type:complete len:703 (+) Transcript_55691:66-2174(+)